MKPSPPGWPRLSVALYYDDPAKAIAWLVEAFDFEVKIKVDGEGGTIVHSELLFGEALVMVAGSGAHRPEGADGRDHRHERSPRGLGGANTQSVLLYVDDVEAHLTRAVAAGAKVTSPLKTTDYGAEYWTDRGYEAEDPEGHRWWIVERLRTAGPG